MRERRGAGAMEGKQGVVEAGWVVMKREGDGGGRPHLEKLVFDTGLRPTNSEKRALAAQKISGRPFQVVRQQQTRKNSKTKYMNCLATSEERVHHGTRT